MRRAGRAAGLAAAFALLCPGMALAQSAIEAAPLSQLDAWTVGALSPGEGALNPSVWGASDAAALGRLFDQIPAAIESPAGRALARRVLASGGPGPRGDGRDEAARKRFAALGRLGLADELAVMAAGAGPMASDNAVAMFGAQAELARGQVQAACARGRVAEAGEPSAFLARLAAYCAATGGERAAIDLAIAALRGTPADDPWLRAALSGLGEGAPRPSVAGRFDTSFNASVSLAAGLRAAPTALAGSSNLALALLARSEATPQPLRAEAVIAALRRGAIGPEEALRLLRATPATAAASPPLAQAVLAAQAEPGGPAAARAIAAALSAPGFSAFAGAAGVLREEIGRLREAPNAASVLLYGRAALAAGDAGLAERVLASIATADVDQRAYIRLLTALGVLNGRITPDVLQRRIEREGPQGAGAASRDIALLSALGAPLDESMRAFVAANRATGGRPARAELLTALDAASRANAPGETALIAVLIIAPGAQNVETDALANVVRALQHAGLDDAARSIVVEAMIAPAGAGA